MSCPIANLIDLIPATVLPIESIDAADLGRTEFWDRYVCHQRPILIRNAVAHWSAIQKWRDGPSFRQLLTESGRATGVVADTMNPSPPWPREMLTSRPIDEALPALYDRPESEAHAVLGFPPPPAWMSDLGEYEFFMTKARKHARWYANRVFAYRNQSSDWHHHMVDETLTTQLRGRKRVSIFRLSNRNYREYLQILDHNLQHIAGARAFFPHPSNLVRYEAILEPGDCLYIPPFYWHALEPVTAEMGITLAHVFRSPLAQLGSLSEPMIRRALVRQLQFGEFRVVFNSLIMLGLSALARAATGQKFIEAP